ncbi:MAG: hypothetical protein M1833_001912, partial [Piccolia ochrophora]
MRVSLPLSLLGLIRFALGESGVTVHLLFDSPAEENEGLVNDLMNYGSCTDLQPFQCCSFSKTYSIGTPNYVRVTGLKPYHVASTWWTHEDRDKRPEDGCTGLAQASGTGYSDVGLFEARGLTYGMMYADCADDPMDTLNSLAKDDPKRVRLVADAHFVGITSGKCYGPVAKEADAAIAAYEAKLSGLVSDVGGSLSDLGMVPGGTPETPETPATPATPGTPGTPVTQGTPGAQGTPGIP